jgi:HlyD family secretion protein
LKIDLKGKVKKLFTMKHSKLVSILLVVAILATTLFANRAAIKNRIFGTKSVTQRTTTVKKGNIQVLVSGSGSVYFTNEKTLYSKIGATVTKVNNKEGDQVKAGAVIAEFDDTEFQSTVASNKLSLEQGEITLQTDNESISNLNITAPFTGQISNIAVSEGDSVQSGGTVFTINDTSELKLTLTYNAADAAKICVGQSANVYIASSMQTAKGTVTYISNVSNGTSSGQKVYSVNIQVPNPGALTSGMTASADIKTSHGTVSSTNTAALSYIRTQSVTSKTGGTVESVYVKQNQQVSSGSLVIVMKDDDLIKTRNSDAMKLSSLQTAYDSSVKQLDNYKITAPFNGTIQKISYKVGDTVTAGAEIADVADTSSMEFDVSVDELDIAKLAVGQTANITLDALSDTTTIKGEVAKVAVSGTASSGVTTYAVTVKIDDQLSKIKSGMNANADIVVTNKKNVLCLPVDAVTTVGSKYYVWVRSNGTAASSDYSDIGSTTTSRASSKTSSSTNMNGGPGSGGPGGGTGGGTGGGGNKSANTNSEATVSTVISVSNSNSSGGNMGGKSNNYYANCARVEVKVGAEDDSNIEIKSGLKEGQVVILPQQTATASSSATTTSTKSTGGMGGGGMMGGGM